jgi:hypothetical protein
MYSKSRERVRECMENEIAIGQIGKRSWFYFLASVSNIFYMYTIKKS